MSITLNGTTGITTPDIDSVAAPDFDGSNLTGIAPFKPVAVSGTTPSLNVGTYNFFKQGALTANTTVSFASVPTESRWSYSFEPAVYSGAWDVSSAYYSQSFSVAAQDTAPSGIFFKPDGLKMYVVGNFGDDVNEYDLRVAWDISTAVFLQLFSVAGQDTAPLGLFFKPDGLKMYVSGSNADSVYEYDLSTAWDVTTAVYLQNLHVGFEDIIPVGLFFKPDGTRMYFAGSTNDNVYEYEVGNVSTMTLPAAVENTPAQRLRSSTQVTYEFITLDGGTTVTLIGEEAV